MKRTLSLILALIILALTAVGCADQTPAANEQGKTAAGEDNTVSALQTTDNTEQPADNTADNTADNDQPQQTVSDDSGIPPLVKPWESAPLNGGYISEAAEAIVTVAEAYLAREIWLQYDNKHYPASGEGTYQQYRPQYHENSPEDCTSQYTGYTNCSAFTYDVYWEALGLDIKCPDTRSLMEDGTDMHVFTYYITGKETEEERHEIGQRFINTVQQGDIIVCRHPAPSTGGHALIYKIGRAHV